MNETPIDPAAPFPYEPVPPDLLAWARQTFDEAEFIREFQEIESGGGLTFESLIAELEERMRAS